MTNSQENFLEMCERISSPLPKNARFEAYYFDLQPTGMALIDSILSAIAIAGKGAHSTTSWNDEEGTNGYYVNHEGLASGDDTAIGLIQANANQAAADLKKLLEKMSIDTSEKA